MFGCFHNSNFIYIFRRTKRDPEVNAMNESYDIDAAVKVHLKTLQLQITYINIIYFIFSSLMESQSKRLKRARKRRNKKTKRIIFHPM